LDFAYIPRWARRDNELNEIHDNQSTQPISQGLSRLSIVA
jgi:hypothetical protein